MLQQIDFLPASYRQKRRGRQKRLWRRSLLAVFLVLVLLGTFGQRQMQSNLRSTRDRLCEQADQMSAQLDDVQALRRRIGHLDAKADLVTFLRIHASPTRVLSAVTNSLPPFVTLTKYRSAYGPIDGKPHKPGFSNKPGFSQLRDREPSAKQPAELDLEWLKENDRQSSLFVSVDGIAPGDVAISNYLAALQRTNIFDQVKLLFTDQHHFREQRMRKFGLIARVRRVRKW